MEPLEITTFKFTTILVKYTMKNAMHSQGGCNGFYLMCTRRDIPAYLGQSDVGASR